MIFHDENVLIVDTYNQDDVKFEVEYRNPITTQLVDISPMAAIKVEIRPTRSRTSTLMGTIAIGNGVEFVNDSVLSFRLPKSLTDQFKKKKYFGDVRGDWHGQTVTFTRFVFNNTDISTDMP